jgi:hypothetical protein
MQERDDVAQAAQTDAPKSADAPAQPPAVGRATGRKRDSPPPPRIRHRSRLTSGRRAWPPEELQQAPCTFRSSKPSGPIQVGLPAQVYDGHIHE